MPALNDSTQDHSGRRHYDLLDGAGVERQRVIVDRRVALLVAGEQRAGGKGIKLESSLCVGLGFAASLVSVIRSPVIDGHAFERVSFLVGDEALDAMTRLELDRQLGGFVRCSRLDAEALWREALGPDDHELAVDARVEVIEQEAPVRTGVRFEMNVGGIARVHERSAGDRAALVVEDDAGDRAAMRAHPQSEIELLLPRGDTSRDIFTQVLGATRFANPKGDVERHVPEPVAPVGTGFSVGKLSLHTVDRHAQADTRGRLARGIADDTFEVAAGLEWELDVSIRAVFEVQPARIARIAIGPGFEQPALGGEWTGLDFALLVSREVVNEIAPARLDGRVGNRSTRGFVLDPDCDCDRGLELELDGFRGFARFGEDHDLAARVAGSRGQPR